MPDYLHKLPPLSLYVHIPWCVRKCPYCDFNSHTAAQELPEEAYVQALIQDLENELPYVQGRKLCSIFFGGGTPSLFSAESIGRIIQAASRRISFEPGIEITLEANPGTFEQKKFSGYRSVGVNRLSIGIQSFNQQHLQKLGRIHSGDEAIAAVQMARDAGFDNFNLDLMHGLPNQTPEQALADLQQAADLGPTHISWYQLTIEPNTQFYSKPPSLPAEDLLGDIQQLGQRFLQENSYQQYEVSAYASAGRQSNHNMNYWEFGDYLGIGAGAHGKITLPAEGRIIRTNKTRAPLDYLAREASYTAGCSAISAQELPLEFMMNALRLTHGVPRHFFQERTGLSFGALNPIWKSLEQMQLAIKSKSRLCTTSKGLQFLDTVLEKFSQ